MWTNILYTAAIPDGKPRPYAAFIEVLKQLFREEAIFYNALYQDLEQRWDAHMALSLAEQANTPFPEPPHGYDLVYAHLQANGYIEQCGSRGEAHNRYEFEVEVAMESLTRLHLLAEREVPGTEPEPIKRLFRTSDNDDVNAKLEYMAIASVFNHGRTTTTVFGDMFAAACRHPEYFLPSTPKTTGQ